MSISCFFLKSNPTVSTQGGAPSPFDRNFSTKISAKAIQWITRTMKDCYKGGKTEEAHLLHLLSPALACVFAPAAVTSVSYVTMQGECLPTPTTPPACWGCGAELWSSSRWRSCVTRPTLCKESVDCRLSTCFLLVSLLLLWFMMNDLLDYTAVL